MQRDYKEKGLTLLKRGQKGMIHAIFSRFGLILLLLLIQLFMLFGVFRWFWNFLPHILGVVIAFDFIMVLYLLNSRINPTAKITWLIVITLMPVFGVFFFCYTRSNLGHRVLKARTHQLITATKDRLPQPEDVMRRLEAENAGVAALAHYMQRSNAHPVSDRTAVTYFPLGEDKFEEMLRQLEAAEHFIFMEYFIVEEGRMWNSILEILEEKARAGLDVRFLYDDLGTVSLLPPGYDRKLEAKGIRCMAFNPFIPLWSLVMNNRDHRKITVIDGHTVFSGGVTASSPARIASRFWVAPT